MDYYTGFCFGVKVPNHAVVLEEIKNVQKAWMDCQQDDCTNPVVEFAGLTEDDSWPDVEVEPLDDDNRLVVFTGEGYCDPHWAGQAVHYLMVKLGPAMPQEVEFEWGSWSSRPVIEGYGGGSALITAKGCAYMATHSGEVLELLREKINSY